MKTKILVLLSLIACLTLLGGPTTTKPAVTLAWNAVAHPSLAGYTLYWGASSQTYTNSIQVAAPATSVTVSNLVRDVTYYFAVTARTTNGLESAYSTEVNYHTLPLPPAPVSVTITETSP